MYFGKRVPASALVEHLCELVKRQMKSVIFQCAEARLTIPVYETAFALSHSLKENGIRGRFGITIISPENLSSRIR